MKISLIITTFNWPESLLLVLKSVRYQTLPPDEIIIADDGSGENTRDLISSYKKQFDLNIIHSWQEDNGFRAARSRNKAIFKSSGDYIIMIDGDIVLHHNFVKDHINSAEKGYFIQGTRSLLTEKETREALIKKNASFSFFSSRLKNRKNAIHSKILSFIFSNKKNYLRGIKSCNMAFFKNDCININGFNNNFEGWGREDSEFSQRLMNLGIKRKTLRFNAIQFHLWHKENSRDLLNKNDAIMQETINMKVVWCENGINNYL